MPHTHEGPASGRAPGDVLDGTPRNKASFAEKQQEYWLQLREMMLAELGEILKCAPADLPPVFIGPAPLPLQIGIDRDILVLFPEADTAGLSRWLKWWTGRPEYQRQLAEGAGRRYDIFGDNAGIVEPDQVAHALKRLGKSQPAICKNDPAPTARPTLHLNFDEDGDTGSGKRPRKINRGYDKAVDTLKARRKENKQTHRIVAERAEDGFVGRILGKAHR